MVMKTRSKYLLLVLFLFLFSASGNILFAQKEDIESKKVNEIRFDGLYRTDQMTDDSPARNKYYGYFRFCEDGTVIGMSSAYAVKQVSKWLFCEADKQKKGFKIGKYKIDNNRISFTTKSESGKVDYEGVIEKKAVILNIFSHINKTSSQNRKYKFVEVSFDKD